MSNNFNYKESLDGIKANLFDIYENQEQAIGLEEDVEKRKKRLNSFIEVKDVALMLIEGINALYENDEEIFVNKKLENPEIPIEEEESKILNLVENSNVFGIKDEDSSNDNSNAFFEEEISIPDAKKYYLDCDMKNVNFAYVPKELYEKIKKNNALEISYEEEIDSSNMDGTVDNNENSFNDNDEPQDDVQENFNLYKEDEEKPRGIIVRSDQYMKLALSKHRQEGVLKEAKKFRMEEVQKRRREEQKRKLEEAEVKLNI